MPQISFGLFIWAKEPTFVHTVHRKSRQVCTSYLPLTSLLAKLYTVPEPGSADDHPLPRTSRRGRRLRTIADTANPSPYLPVSSASGGSWCRAIRTKESLLRDGENARTVGFQGRFSSGMEPTDVSSAMGGSWPRLNAIWHFIQQAILSVGLNDFPRNPVKKSSCRNKITSAQCQAAGILS